MNYRRLRTMLAILIFAALNAAFLDVSGWCLQNCAWLAKWQLVPAFLALNALALAVILGVTYFGGRYYCSILCPLGIYQDVLGRLSRRLAKRRCAFKPARTKWRFSALIVFVALGVCGFFNVASLIEPYGMYGRIANNLFAPIVQNVNNWLDLYCSQHDSYAFGAVPVRPLSAWSLGIALVSFVAVSALAWKEGRGYCNTICPVGTFLGMIGERSVYRVQLNADNCRSCQKCVQVCKCNCIDIANKRVDTSRCVVCGRCWEACQFKGISYRR